MKGKIPRKFKRYLTQPEDFSTQNKKKCSNLTLKQLKLQVSAMDNLNDIYPSCMPSKSTLPEKSTSAVLPLQSRIQNKRNALKKLPQLINTPHFNNGNEEQRTIQNPALFKVANPLFVVNTLFQILKEDITIQDQPIRETHNKRPEIVLPERKRMERNEFEEVTAKSVKIHRPPRVLDHELSRLTQQSNFSRRKIYSEEKSRPKIGEKEVELLTFYKPRQKREEKSVDEMNQFL